jgi:hypothetical protein
MMAFVAGLAPAKHGLERPAARLLGAHEQSGLRLGNGARASARFMPRPSRSLKRPEGRAPKVVPGVGIAPTSPRLQRGANLSQLPGDSIELERVLS